MSSPPQVPWSELQTLHSLLSAPPPVRRCRSTCSSPAPDLLVKEYSESDSESSGEWDQLQLNSNSNYPPPPTPPPLLPSSPQFSLVELEGEIDLARNGFGVTLLSVDRDDLLDEAVDGGFGSEEERKGLAPSPYFTLRPFSLTTPLSLSHTQEVAGVWTTTDNQIVMVSDIMITLD